MDGSITLNHYWTHVVMNEESIKTFIGTKSESEYLYPLTTMVFTSAIVFVSSALTTNFSPLSVFRVSCIIDDGRKLYDSAKAVAITLYFCCPCCCVPCGWTFKALLSVVTSVFVGPIQGEGTSKMGN